MPDVILVEDEAAIRDLLTAVLSNRGYGVRAFSSSREALTSIHVSPPDLLLTDVGLEDEDAGLRLVARVRESFPAAVLPVVVVSGRGGEEDFLRAFAAGADDYLRKPWHPDELLARCAFHLSRVGLSDVSGVAPRQSAAPAEVLFGRYRLQGELGRGSYGAVHAAWDEKRQCRVALKVLTALALTQQDGPGRYWREVVALAAVRSPHVPRLLDWGEEAGTRFLALECVRGPALPTVLRSRGPLGEDDLIRLLRGLALALAALGEANLVHRDVKPGNILLRDGRCDRPVLVDFGLAKPHLGQGITQERILVGSPGYIAPEVIMGEEADHQSDMFSLGMVALYALRGREPYPHLSGYPLLDVMVKRPVELPETVSPQLREVLRRLTEREPAARYAGASQLLADLLPLDPGPLEDPAAEALGDFDGGEPDTERTILPLGREDAPRE